MVQGCVSLSTVAKRYVLTENCQIKQIGLPDRYHKNCRIQLLVVLMFCKIKQNRKSDDDAVACTNGRVKAYRVQTVQLEHYASKNLDGMSYAK